MFPEPLPIGVSYDGSAIAEVVRKDETDPDLPYLYQLADGRQVWIPADHWPANQVA